MLAELPDIPVLAQAIPQAPFLYNCVGIDTSVAGLVNSTVSAIIWIIVLEVGKRMYQWNRDMALNDSVYVFE